MQKTTELPATVHLEKISTKQLSWCSVMRYYICDVSLMFSEQIFPYYKLIQAMQEAENYMFALQCKTNNCKRQIPGCLIINFK